MDQLAMYRAKDDGAQMAMVEMPVRAKEAAEEFAIPRLEHFSYLS